MSVPMKTKVQTTRAYVSRNPLSQAVRIKTDEFVFCSGQLPINPLTGKRVEGGPDAEMRQVMENLKAVLEEAGCTFENVIKTTVFVTKLEQAEANEVNAVYRNYFTEPYPARSLVEVAGLNGGCKIEVECIAAR